MEILYVLSVIVLAVAFMLFKKSDEKLNFIKWVIIFIVSLYGYNIFLGMVLGLLNITSHLWLLSLINLAFAVLLGYKAIRKKEIQKYFVTKLSIAGLIIIFIIFGVMFFKDLYIHKGDVTHSAVDAAVHYRAAKHYSDNLKIFINVEDKTFFNFNVMQPGAYINDGIFINVINGITGAEHVYVYQVFEVITLFLCGLSLYSCFIDKIKTKRGLIGSLVLFGLYLYGYPYNSWIFGFSYLSVGIVMTTMLVPVVEMLYSKENVTRKIVVPLIVLLATGLIFSYCLFVPAIFAAICIYCFLKDFTIEGKTYLKFFKKTTLLITGLLLLVTAAGIGYLFIPTFFIEGQTNLVDALKIDGEIYNEKYLNFFAYIPFAIMYLFEFIKKFKDRELEYSDIFAVVLMGFYALLNIGLAFGFVSQYYMFKIYFILWIVIFNVTIELVNKYVDEKNFRIDIILLGLLYAFLVFKAVSPVTIIKIFVLILFVGYAFIGELIRNHKINGLALVSVFVIYKLLRGTDFNSVFKLYMLAFLVFYTVIPGLSKKIDFDKIKEILTKVTQKLKLTKLVNCFTSIIKKVNLKTLCVSGYVYVTIWGLFVCGWVWIKAGHVIGEAEKHALPNFVGIYYDENCNYRKLIDMTTAFNDGSVELALWARDNIEDLSADNITLMTEGYFNRIWATSILEIDSEKLPYQNFVQDAKIYTIEDGLKDPERKYLVRCVWDEMQRQNAYKEEIKEIREMENIEILFENENGYVARIKGR
ncbi:MAG: hypothetical protein IKL55_02515 [Clostridia bacterium]|nr:hypothetical protein [Clostridia bacterium]